MQNFIEILKQKNIKYTVENDIIRVLDNLRFYLNPLKSLPDNLIIEGDMDIFGTKISQLPDNLIVCSNLNMSYTKISKLPESPIFRGDLNISST